MALTAEERKYWEDKGFAGGRQGPPSTSPGTGPQVPGSWPGWEGTIVKGARPKTKGISVEFLRKENHFPEIFVYHPTNLELIETPKPAKGTKMPEPKRNQVLSKDRRLGTSSWKPRPRPYQRAQDPLLGSLRSHRLLVSLWHTALVTVSRPRLPLLLRRFLGALTA